MATNFTVLGQVILPEAMGEAAIVGADAGARCGAGVIIEPEATVKRAEAYINRLKDMSRRRPLRGFSTEEIMRITRGDN